MTRRLATLLSILLVSGSALAVPPPIELTRHRGRLADLVLSPRARSVRPTLPWFGAPDKTLASPGPTNVTAVRYDIQFDPVAGGVIASIEIDLEATTGSVSGFALYVDDGLSVQAATAPATTVTHSLQTYPPYNVVSLSFDPPITAGSSLTVHVDYAGTANCTASGDSAQCSYGGSMPFMLESSVIPALVDAAGFGGYNAWAATRSLTLRVPSGIDVVASGELAEKTDDGTTLVTRWETPGYQSIGGYLAVMGDLSEVDSPGLSVATGVHGLTSAPAWTTEMGGWMQTILPFIDEQAGAPLPYAKLNVIKLPPGAKFPGTAGHAITLLSEDYATPGARYFEETLAHENAHQWWGVLVSPTDTLLSRWLSEGLATLAQVDYTAAQRIPAAERDAYLAWRYREHRVLVRYHTAYETFPPLVVQNPAQAPAEHPQYTIWAYIRSAAILESLRAAIGDQAFATALASYREQCSTAACDTSDFQQALELASGEDFTAVFAGWVYEAHYPRPGVSWSEEPAADGVRARVEFSDDQGIETPLELWIELADGTVDRRKIRVGPGKTSHEFLVATQVRSIRPSPRHDAVVWSRSAVSGDQDFDQEVDGFDLIQCARAIGKSSEFMGQAGDGILGIDLDFDPRCDVDENGVLEDADLKPTFEAFGTLRKDAR